jgi:glycosyltransferase involved in cell wall biosynthesis
VLTEPVVQPGSRQTASPRRILQLVTNLHFGGAEKLTTDLSLALHERGHDVRVASWLDEHAILAERLREHGVPVLPISFPKPGLRALLRTIADVRRVIREVEPEVIHAHNPAAGTIALAARALAGRRRVPVVTTYHGVRPTRLRAAGRLLSGADAVVAVGPSAAEQLRTALPHEHVVEINNAVFVERTRSSSDVREELGVDGGVLLAAVGRLVPEKGQSLLVEAVGELVRRGRFEAGLVLVVVGYGPLWTELEAQIERLGLAGHVVLAGGRADAADIIASADVLVHASIREALPLVLLEAMAQQVPVVAVEATGVSDVVQDRATGLLVPERDPVAFADAVEEMLDDDELRERVVAGASELVEQRFPVAAMVERHERLYEGLVAARR